MLQTRGIHSAHYHEAGQKTAHLPVYWQVITRPGLAGLHHGMAAFLCQSVSQLGSRTPSSDEEEKEDAFQASGN